MNITGYTTLKWKSGWLADSCGYKYPFTPKPSVCISTTAPLMIQILLYIFAKISGYFLIILSKKQNSPRTWLRKESHWARTTPLKYNCHADVFPDRELNPGCQFNTQHKTLRAPASQYCSEKCINCRLAVQWFVYAECTLKNYTEAFMSEICDQDTLSLPSLRAIWKYVKKKNHHCSILTQGGKTAMIYNSLPVN